ncbi:hypothetical protein ACLHDG_04975 [Sulfurovum sp. CS9]|uniref:hypothetical protein n=1 Tax=Sulfurovum sp. CS9 TaxID=3391146 RepID=UPI0039E75AD6
MKATISVKGNEYILEIGDTQVVLGGQGGLSDENIKEMLKMMKNRGANQVTMRSQGGLSPENIKEMLELMKRSSNPPIEVIFTLEGMSDS